jgi:hypothetical protein
MPSRRREGSPAAMWGRSTATSGPGLQLSSPQVEWRWRRGRGVLRRRRTAVAGGGAHGGSGWRGVEAKYGQTSARVSYPGC